MRKKAMVMLSALAFWGCDDAAVTPGTNGSADAGGTADSSVSITASSVAVDPHIPSLDASDVQRALEELAAAALTLGGRVAALEESAGPAAPVAADIPFDPSKTHVQATNLQTLGEALDLTAQLLEGDVAAATSAAESATVDITALEVAVSALEDEITQQLAKHTKGIADAFTALDYVQYAAHTLLENPGTPAEDQIFASGLLKDGKNVYSAISFLWSQIQPLSELASKPCPDDMVALGGSFCVDKNRFEFQSSWTSFTGYCIGDGRRLCRPGELFIACSTAGIALDEKGPGGGFEVEELMDQLLPGGEATALSGEDCNVVKSHPMESGLYWARCCKDLTPTLPK